MKILFAVSLLAFSLKAADVRLEWNANAETNIVGYRLYLGTNSGNYIGSIATTNITATVSNVPAGITFFAVTALNDEGQESDYSGEVAFTNLATGRFVVILDNWTLAQVDAITEMFKKRGWELCSGIKGAWLLSGVSDEISSRVIAEELTSNSLIGGKVKLVIKIQDGAPMTYWGNAQKEVWVWMAKFWGKAK